MVRLDNRCPDGLTPNQRWDRERLAKWAAWDPEWHNQQAQESEAAQQWFAALFISKQLVNHAPNDPALAARLKAAETALKAASTQKTETVIGVPPNAEKKNDQSAPKKVESVVPVPPIKK